MTYLPSFLIFRASNSIPSWVNLALAASPGNQLRTLSPSPAAALLAVPVTLRRVVMAPEATS